jgi:hypothetical protein
MALGCSEQVYDDGIGKSMAENMDEGARFFFTLPVTRKPETREVA